jgi:acetyltransferase-like isoleucine patch superfamily enzyme
MILAHMQSFPPRAKEFNDYVSVRVEDDAYIGPGAIVLPNVRIRRDAIMTAEAWLPVSFLK